MISKFVLKNSGSIKDAEDVFQDAIVIIFEKIRNDNLELTCTLKTYLYSVCRNIWLQHLTKKNKTKLVDYFEIEKDMNIVIDNAQYFEEEKLFHQHYAKLSTKCRKLLELYFGKVPYKNIADQLNISISNVKTSKFRCKELLYTRIKNDPQYKKLKLH
jgi:RNA polymerase sigma factor (sigma-70 family)